MWGSEIENSKTDSNRRLWPHSSLVKNLPNSACHFPKSSVFLGTKSKGQVSLNGIRHGWLVMDKSSGEMLYNFFQGALCGTYLVLLNVAGITANKVIDPFSLILQTTMRSFIEIGTSTRGHWKKALGSAQTVKSINGSKDSGAKGNWS